jgi:hypothetical protein
MFAKVNQRGYNERADHLARGGLQIRRLAAGLQIAILSQSPESSEGATKG